MNTRRDLLRQYVMALIAEGYLDPRIGSREMMRKIATAVQEDAKTVLEDVARFVTENVVGHYTDKIGAKVKSVVADASKRGLNAVWKDIMGAYWSGVDGGK